MHSMAALLLYVLPFCIVASLICSPGQREHHQLSEVIHLQLPCAAAVHLSPEDAAGRVLVSEIGTITRSVLGIPVFSPEPTEAQ